MTTATDISLLECIDIISECFSIRIVFPLHDKNDWSEIIGYSVACSSVIRKQYLLPFIKAFVETQELPVRVEDKYPDNNSFQIYQL